MVWKQDILASITLGFSRPSEDINVTRQQCINVGATVLLFVIMLIDIVMGLLTGISITAGWPAILPLVLLSSVLIHSKCTRRPQSSRLLLIGIVWYNFHFQIIRGGFAYSPTSSFVGLLAPILSIFLSSTSVEPVIWFAVWLIGSLAILLAEFKQSLPTAVAREPKHLMTQNLVSVLFLSVLYLTIFWFIVHVYTAEAESRHTLEKELHLFMRLSHEIRTPVTVINGMAEIMKDWQGTPEQKCLIADLGSASRRLSVVVSDLLAYFDGDGAGAGAVGNNGHGREGAGGEGAEPSMDFNIRDAVDVAIGYHLPQAEMARLRVYTDIPSDLPLEVNGAKDRLISILDHLFGNAVKFTSAGSVTIQVRLDSHLTYGHHCPCEFRFEIRDTGLGMTPEEREAIFRPFVQLNSGPNREFGGVGLGLTLAMQLANRWGRAIHATSDGHGRGSCFVFSAPFVVRTTLTKRFHHPVNVLLIDDDGFSARGLMQLMTALGADIDRATFATLAMDRYRTTEVVFLVFPHVKSAEIEMQQNMVSIYVKRVRSEAVSPDRQPAIMVVGPSYLQSYCRDTLGIIHLQNPPALLQVMTAFRSVLLAPFTPSHNKARSPLLPPIPEIPLGAENGLLLLSPPPAAQLLPSSTQPLNLSHSPARPIPKPLDLGATAAASSSSSSTSVSSPSPSMERLVQFAPPTNPRHLASIETSSFTQQHQQTYASSSLLSPGSSHCGETLLLGSGSGGGPGSEATGPTNMSSLLESPHPQSLMPESSARILCVDDNSIVLKLLTTFIMKTGFSGFVDTALSGEEAVQKVTQNPYALIFMDFNMPGMNGADATIRIRQLTAVSTIATGAAPATGVRDSSASEQRERGSGGAGPIIVGVTAATNMRDVCLNAGMDDVIYKPFTPDKIRALVTRHVPAM